ncbi:MAG: ABC transporter permease [Chloroflexi bacterium]|nr:ABC transporter permease [Chloroflexota bacterium]
MSSIADQSARVDARAALLKTLDVLSMPAIAMVLAFGGGALIIWITSGDLGTVFAAYGGMINGAFFKTRGLSETLVATTPYIFLALAVSLGFKAGLFNIGVEGQFYIGAISAAWAGVAFAGLPAIIHLPLMLLASALGGAVWGMIPGYLKAKTGAHEVINTIMMNYIAFRFVEYLVSGPLRDSKSSAVQTERISRDAELWSLYQIPERLSDPGNALLVSILVAFSAIILARLILAQPRWTRVANRALMMWGAGIASGILTFIALPPLTRAVWLFTDQYDRMHVGLLGALAAAAFVAWLLWKTTLGFEMRMTGASPDAARYAGVNSTRTIVVTMAISGALAGMAGATEVLGVSICRCLPLFFSSGYGFESIAIALLAKNSPLGIVFGAFLFGAMRNGSDLMELNSGVSKYVISLIQGLVLLFVAAPLMLRALLRMRAPRAGESDAPLTRGWGG